jgi:hypothetical protein
LPPVNIAYVSFIHPEAGKDEWVHPQRWRGRHDLRQRTRDKTA